MNLEDKINSLIHGVKNFVHKKVEIDNQIITNEFLFDWDGECLHRIKINDRAIHTSKSYPIRKILNEWLERKRELKHGLLLKTYK
jgi:hypothetical protein